MDPNSGLGFDTLKTNIRVEQFTYLFTNLSIVIVIYCTILLLLFYLVYDLLIKHSYYKRINLTLFYVLALLVVITRLGNYAASLELLIEWKNYSGKAYLFACYYE
jgi:hypothetical protein